MKRNFTFLTIMVLIILAACQKDLPEPETKVSAAELVGSSNPSSGTFQVRAFVKGNDVFIECHISDFSFRNNNTKNRSGKLQVYINRKKYKEYSSAAFILKDMTKGTHNIMLQIVDSKGNKTSMKKQIAVTIR